MTEIQLFFDIMYKQVNIPPSHPVWCVLNKLKDQYRSTIKMNEYLWIRRGDDMQCIKGYEKRDGKYWIKMPNTIKSEIIQFEASAMKTIKGYGIKAADPKDIKLLEQKMESLRKSDEYLNEKNDTPRPATPRTPDGKIHCWTDTGRVNLKLLAQVTDEESLESIQQRRDATGQCSEYLDQYADFDASVIQQRSVTKPEVGNAVGECLDFAAGLKERNKRKLKKTKHIFTASKKNVWISSYNAAFS